MLVHGEANNMSRLKQALQNKYKARDEDIKIHTPRNLETLKLTFRGERVAKVLHTPLFVALVSDILQGDWTPGR